MCLYEGHGRKTTKNLVLELCLNIRCLNIYVTSEANSSSQEVETSPIKKTKKQTNKSPKQQK